MPTAYLPDRGVMKVVGEEARAFLQGLVTCDMAQVRPGLAAHGALLTPQGKIIVDFVIFEAPEADGGGFFLDCPLALAPDLMARLNRYRMRAKVTVEDISEAAGVLAAWGDGPPTDEDGLVVADPRLAALGWRVLAERRRASALGNAPAEAYHAQRIALGVPEGGRDFSYGDTFPHEANMDVLAGVSFSKGCYVGQEVVARMQHRGSGGRTRVVPVRLADGFAVEPGMAVMAGDRAVGFMGSQAKGLGLAKLRLDRVAEAQAAGLTLTAGGMVVEVVR